MARGRHRLYVGPAPGTGTTVAVRDEARRRLERGDHVVVIDDLAGSNAAGSRHEKRWQDVEELLSAGTDVISTVGIQHLDARGGPDGHGVVQDRRELVPDEVVCSADEIELVDLSPAALRERGLPWLADRVEQRRGKDAADGGTDAATSAREPVVVALSGGADGESLLRRGARIASSRAGGELLAVHVAPVDGPSGPPPPALGALRLLTEELDGTWRPATGSSPAEGILDVAREVDAGHVVVGSTKRPRWRTFAVPSTAERVIAGSGDIDVHVVTHSTSAGPGGRSPRATLRRKRARLGYLVALLGPIALTALLALLPRPIDLPVATPLYLLLAVVVALMGGIGPSLVAVVSSSVLLTWFLAPPTGALTITAREDAVALSVFVVVTVVVAFVIHRVEVRAERAVAAGEEAAVLADLTHTLLASPDPMHLLLEHAVDLFGARRAQVVRRATADAPPEVVAESDPAVPQATGTDASRFDDETVVPVNHTHDLVLAGVQVRADGRRLLDAFATDAAAILQRRAQQRSAGGSVDAPRVDPGRAGRGAATPVPDGPVEPSSTA